MLKRLPVVSALSWALVAVPAAALARQVPAAPDTPGPDKAATKLTAPSYQVTRAKGTVKVDGRVDPAEWEGSPAIPIAFEFLPGDNVKPPVDTIVHVVYDDDNVYVAFRCLDPDPKAIRAHLMDRDAINTFIQDDHVSLLIDSFNDERRGFQFRVNPLGVQADAIFSQVEGVEDWSWDIIWASAGRITTEGYEVEVAIPLNQIRFPSGGGVLTWGFELGRSYPRNLRHRISANPRDRNQQCLLCQVNKLTGFEGLKPGLNLELDPTFTANRTDRAPAPGASLEKGDPDAEFGITGRWGVTSGLTFNGTVNPDFSQVEADVAQLEVNTRFALFYPEKRPFFLEGVDFFVTPLQTVFTRTVVDPRWGAKLAGKQGRNVIGVFVTEDRANSLVLPSNQGSIPILFDENVMGTVLRYRRDVGRGATLGALFTGRQGGDYYNRVGGVDAFVPVTAVDELRVQYVWSDTRDEAQAGDITGRGTASFGGHGARVNYLRTTRHWMVEGEYEDLAADFRADAGFIPRVDLRRGYGSVDRIWWGERDDWWTRILVGGFYEAVGDQDNTLTDEAAGFRGSVLGPWQSVARVGYGRTKERFAGMLYEGVDVIQAGMEMQPSGLLRFALETRWGDVIDYANNRLSGIRQLRPTLDLKLGRHVTAILAHTMQQLVYEDSQVYMANLSEARLFYHFSVRSFVRAILQYRDLNRNPSLYDFPVPRDQQQFFTQLLFSYKLNPQTVVFVGYSDNQLGVDNNGLDRADRTFFIKLGYAWIR